MPGFDRSQSFFVANSLCVQDESLITGGCIMPMVTAIFVKGDQEVFSTPLELGDDDLIFDPEVRIFWIGRAIQNWAKVNGSDNLQEWESETLEKWEMVKFLGIDLSGSTDDTTSVSNEDWESSPNREHALRIAKMLKHLTL